MMHVHVKNVRTKQANLTTWYLSKYLECIVHIMYKTEIYYGNSELITNKSMLIYSTNSTY